MTKPRIKLVAEAFLCLTITVAMPILHAAVAAAQPPTPAQKPLSATSKPTEGIRFPADGGVLNVVDFGAVPDDGEDDTSAIQAALDKHPNGNRIIYVPAGEYIVTDTLRWADGPHSGTKQKRTILQGQGRDLTTIRVPDGTAGFNGEQNSSKAVIWTGRRPAQRFRNAIRDLTVHTGRDNPGAIGIQFNASNQGTIRNVRIVSGDRQGRIGLDLGHTDEIGPLLVRHLTVEGFDEGIRTWWPVNSCTFEHITLKNQNKFGWHNYHQMIFVRGLKSENQVPAIFNRKDSWGTVTLVDSVLLGLPGAEKTAGVLNQRQLYVRNTKITGYGKSIDNADKGRDKGDVEQPGLVTEDTSHTNVASQFLDLDGTLPEKRSHLPVKETPEVSWGDPRVDWANIVDFGADPDGKTDSSTALQAAIDSGAKTVYLPGGSHFYFNGEVLLRGGLERFIGLEGRCRFGDDAVWRLVDGDQSRQGDDVPVVIIERCSNQSGGQSVTILHESARTFVVSSWIGAHVIGRGSGDIFLDDYCGRLDLESAEHYAWCRQLNTEREGTMLTNNGASLWILGMKTEKIGTIIHTKGGGFTDLLGCFIYSNQGWDNTIPAFLIEDSTANLCGLNERNYNRRPCDYWFQEIVDGVERTRKERAWVYLSR
ncbi:glycoside hydrolase family 55 protein [Thalassoroseus pseudoceratinae]|uniref:glycoside hydrolase family 55 protein n=1 Tax=Thalassoroseus pseudoceratinae TaxID=2713176 RepID=UPI001423FFF8|nr:glycoside hydrolase family 55 protein [Thalassoroseus pseudoceratinae]